MPLTQEQELAEHELRMDQMAVNIEKMRADMALDQKAYLDSRLAADKVQMWETRKFIVQVAVGAAALLGAGVALGNYLTAHMH
jgi:hypothetical protein